MLDLDRLFLAKELSSSVPGCAQDSSEETIRETVSSTPDELTSAPICSEISNSSKSLNSQGIEEGYSTIERCTGGHSGHNLAQLVFNEVCPSEPLRGKGSEALGTVGTPGTDDFKGRGKKNYNDAAGGGAAINEFAPHPAAVMLLMAWSKTKQADKEERTALLLNLENQSPADQVRYWHGMCVQDGLKPWQVLCVPAPMSGDDCTMCKHLTTMLESIGKDRQRYHWACSLGYLILEHGRGTERIWIAPPECESWERWYPSDQR